ncbi:flavodoxin family protein [Desulfosarcina ovata subsp. sediminis]|uniref:Flavodoxin family protein n=1 Tax=Desulfosarcina ovata subsp. sediminis TaxID=885957 RepID=A0A5K7ZU85_9BACT|nr:flavodoxin family protein [Desulfosarcina ovata]BBO83793.1 flavodoxin family protein [Desulfosarcina ovata subsp. sediminis]
MPESLIIDLSHTKPENKVLGFSGSPRKNGNSDILLKTIISGVKQLSIPATTWNLTDVQFKGCIGCEKCRKTKICTGLIDGMTSLYPKLYSSKGLILVSPTHNYNITSWMKAFIDRLYCFYTFEDNRPRSWSSQLGNQNRKAVVAAICEQESVEDMGFTLEAMKAPLKALGYEIIGELSVFRIFDKAKVKNDERAMNDAYKLGQKLAKELK